MLHLNFPPSLTGTIIGIILNVVGLLAMHTTAFLFNQWNVDYMGKSICYVISNETLIASARRLNPGIIQQEISIETEMDARSETSVWQWLPHSLNLKICEYILKCHHVIKPKNIQWGK